MNPYKIDIEKLKESKEVTEGKDLLKLKLVTAFLKITKCMTTEEILDSTNLDKSDLSRLRALNFERFSIDRLISLLDNLGFSTNINIKPKSAS